MEGLTTVEVASEKVESPDDIVQFNLRQRRWMKNELQAEANHFNMSLNSYLIHIYENREKPKMK
ncbi:hypothetical protein [Bacillus sp. B3-WWTP-C-10-D-3]|uniref:hypothetical protein n=1 Tax=Bacillus sp. B3-WWTP-C-10-D-3 TaxID=2653217 RepID=UPI001262633F|nr:hypothetical protein [Bacillus sp. B3-WWTP-C-10-D-3]KAB7640284.1 hypothetical protein GBN83_09270 [Bacillus sp. B3-WWTP-C-10-D-3]